MIALDRVLLLEEEISRGRGIETRGFKSRTDGKEKRKETSGEHAATLTRLTRAGHLDPSPLLPIRSESLSSPVSRSERIDSYYIPSLAGIPRQAVYTDDSMGNRKWPRGVRGWPCVHLAYVKFMSGLPRNYHCGNSGEGGEERLEREREREGEEN